MDSDPKRAKGVPEMQVQRLYSLPSISKSSADKEGVERV
jgi:hypothetical protein